MAFAKKNAPPKPTLAERKATKNAEAAAVADMDNPLLNYYLDKIESLNKAYNITTSALTSLNPLSTGNLVLDLLTGGGLPCGTMTQFSGQEASSKTTASVHVFGEALKTKNMLIRLADPENSLNEIYARNILGVPVEEVFGTKDSNGSWVRRPRAFYSDSSGFESFFLHTRDLLLSLPERRYMPEEKSWFLVWPSAKDGVRERLKTLGMTPSAKLFSSTGKYWVKTEETGPAGIVICDSFPALLGESHDETGDDSGTSGLAETARLFSTFLPKVVGKLRSKGFILLGINQIRERPGRVKSLYECGGRALQFYSGLRIRFFATGVPHASSYKVDELEPASWVDDANDKYVYKSCTITKNKSAGTAGFTGLLRVWTKDSNGEGRGYCPAYDAYQYCLMTGLADGKRTGFRLVGNESIATPKKVTFLEFKKYILAAQLGPNEKKEAAKLLGYKSYIDLRETFFAEIRSGVGFKKMTEKNQSKGISAKEEIVETDLVAD